MSKGRVAPSVPAEPYLRKDLRDPKFAAAYLTLAAEEEVPGDFLWALREVVEAYGGIGAIAKRAKLNRQQLYKTLSGDGNPEIRTLWAILDAAGFVLAVVPRSRPNKRIVTSSTRRKNPVRARHAAQVVSA